MDATTLLPKTIRTDPFRLKQIVNNLVGNALKFTNRGEVRLNISWTDYNEKNRSPQNGYHDATGSQIIRRTPGFDPKPVNGTLFFSIQDTGIGIPEDRIMPLFLPFLQGDESMSRRFGGTGLGLAISKRLTELLHGDIRVSSTPGKGSTFTLSLPMGFSDGCHWIDLESELQSELEKAGTKKINRLEMDSVAAPPLPAEKPLEGLRVLLVEDGADNRRLFTLILRKAGAIVVEAENGQIGLDKATQETFDVILMDMQMPVMDGYTATATLRTQGYDRPIVALTAHAFNEEKKRCLDIGCDDYASKPIDRNVLIETVFKSAKKGTLR